MSPPDPSAPIAPAPPDPPRVGLWPRLGLAASAVGLGLRHGACPQDDAFISFRYARHLLDGHGLVYNPGERVEGITNLLWTLILAGAMGTGADPVLAAAALGLVGLGAAVLLAGALGRAAGPGSAAVAAALVAVDPHTALEAVEGLETAAHMALLAAGALRFCRELDRPGPWAHLGSSLVFSVAALSRPEAPLVPALLHLGALLPGLRRPSAWARALASGLPLALTLGLLTGFRLTYYGDPLPNTFYAKAGGWAVPRGIAYLGGHAAGHPALWLLFALALPGALRDRRAWPLLAAVIGQLAYVLSVGGDFKPTGRFVMPVLPLMAAVAARPLAGRRWPAFAVAGAVLLGGAAAGDAEVRGWAEERRANHDARRALGLFLREQVPPGTWIAIHSAGAVPYYAGLPTIDMWGLTDRHIARAPAPALGTGLAGHERADPGYVFSRDPALYLPEDRLITVRPWAPPVEPGFPADFEAHYTPVSVPWEGRTFNFWVRRGFFQGLRPPAPGG